MKVTVVRPDELDASEAKLWHEFQALSPMAGHPCLSLDYARAVCRADDNGRVAVVEDGGKICAFMPYSKESDGVAATLGGGQTALDGLVSSTEHINLRAAVRAAGLRGWRFSRAPIDQHALDPYRYPGSFHEELIYFSDLRNGYDGYLRGLSKGGRNEIGSAERRRRALEREVREVSFEWHSSNPSHLPLLLNWKSAAFESMRQWLSSPSNSALVRELADSDSEDYSCLTSVLYADGKPISISLNLRRGQIISQWISGFDPEYSRFSPGTLNMLAMFAEAAECGVEIADFGYGNDRYKPRFANGVHTVTGGGVWASRLGGALRSLYRKARFHD